MGTEPTADVPGTRRRTNPPPACRATRGGTEPTPHVSSHTKVERAHRQRVEPHEGGTSPPPTCRATRRRSEPTAAVSSHTKVSPARDVEYPLPARDLPPEYVNPQRTTRRKRRAC